MMLSFFKKYFYFLIHPQVRIRVAHILLIVLLLIDVIFFTKNIFSYVLQVLMIVFIAVHDRDHIYLKKKVDRLKNEIEEDRGIFDRNVIVSESDLEGKITYVNEKFCEISGYTKEELLGRSHNLLRSDMLNDFYKDLWETIKSGKTFHGKFKNIKKDGSEFWVDASISPIHRGNHIVGYKAIRFDITDQMKAEIGLKNKISQTAEQLQIQSNRFEFAINSSRDGFWDYNLESGEFYLSSGWKKRLGFDVDAKLTYLDYLALIPDEYRFEHHSAMHNIIEEYPEGSDLEYVHFRIRYPLITKNKEKLTIEDVGDAFFSPVDSSLTRITGFHRDITEQERQNKIIESQNRIAAMGEMISNIAHQWRQPIGAINNTLNDLEFDIELEDLEKVDAKHVLATTKKVKEYTAHLSQTIDDFRNISSDEKTKTEFNINEVLEEARNIVQSEYRKSKITLTLSTDEHKECLFLGYKRELLQVVLNILNNAKDVLLEKNISDPLVKLGTIQDNLNLKIFIHDNAGGVPEAIKEKIFDPYFTTKHESIGTGIGLYMSKKMIQEHFDGTLEVENIANGAMFIITLPKN